MSREPGLPTNPTGTARGTADGNTLGAAPAASESAVRDAAHTADAADAAGTGGAASLDAPPIRSFCHDDWTVADMVAAKGPTTVSVALPARNEAATVGRIVEVLVRDTVEVGLVDELVVMDDHSNDDTASAASDAGARVVHARDVLSEFGRGHGKGEVLWKSLHATSGDLVLWCDADINDFGAHMVTGLLGPLLCEPDVELVKGFYHRPEADGVGGGRVTELVARPLLSLLFPALAGLHQPLSGEYGGRRNVLDRLPFVQGYGVEVGLLLHYLRQRGTTGLAQVDLEERRHRNRPLDELGPQAMAIVQTILRHAQGSGLHAVDGPSTIPAVAELLRPGRAPVTVDVSERPPMIEVAAYLDLLGPERPPTVERTGGVAPDVPHR